MRLLRAHAPAITVSRSSGCTLAISTGLRRRTLASAPRRIAARPRRVYDAPDQGVAQDAGDAGAFVLAHVAVAEQEHVGRVLEQLHAPICGAQRAWSCSELAASKPPRIAANGERARRTLLNSSSVSASSCASAATAPAPAPSGATASRSAHGLTTQRPPSERSSPAPRAAAERSAWPPPMASGRSGRAQAVGKKPRWHVTRYRLLCCRPFAPGWALFCFLFHGSMASRRAFSASAAAASASLCASAARASSAHAATNEMSASRA